MTDWYKKIDKLDLNDWVVTKFYHYTSIPHDIFGEYDTAWHEKPVGDPYLKELFDHFFAICDTYFVLSKENDNSTFKGTLRDNKITIEITNIKTNEKLYIGYKDWRYLIGKSVWSEFGYYTSFGMINYYTKD